MNDTFKNKVSKIVQKYEEKTMKSFQNFSLNPQQGNNNPNNYGFYPQNWSNQVNQMNLINQQNNIMMNDAQINFSNNQAKGLNISNQNNQNGNKNKSSLSINSNVNNGISQQFNGMNPNMLNNTAQTNGNSSNNTNSNQQNFNAINILNNQRKNSTNSNIEPEERKSQQVQQNGKFTCRFELQIENDKEFQVARRLIGAKVKYYLLIIQLNLLFLLLSHLNMFLPNGIIIKIGMQYEKNSRSM